MWVETAILYGERTYYGYSGMDKGKSIKNLGERERKKGMLEGFATNGQMGDSIIHEVAMKKKKKSTKRDAFVPDLIFGANSFKEIFRVRSKMKSYK